MKEAKKKALKDLVKQMRKMMVSDNKKKPDTETVDDEKIKKAVEKSSEKSTDDKKPKISSSVKDFFKNSRDGEGEGGSLSIVKISTSKPSKPTKNKKRR